MTLKFSVMLTLVLILYTVLNWFEAVYGLKIYLGKSELVPVGLVPNIELLVNVLDCKQGTFL